MVEAASADSRLEPAPHGSALAAVPTHGGCGSPTTRSRSRGSGSWTS